ncbi:MAG: gamma-glutamyl-gamma-aminobutyrate hydrolase family protein [Christensenellales bacterium]
MKRPPKRFWIVWTVSFLQAAAMFLPSRYGEETLPACGEDDPQRDIFELLIIPMAIARNMPIFGICRGIQVLNVAMGGTLIKILNPSKNIPTKTHQQGAAFHGQPVHTVRFERGSVFERITGATEIKANSMHHQAIKKPADGLQVDGRAEDGIIEAMSAKDGSRIFAVQFHPEYLSDHDAHAQRLFDHFVKLSREYQSEKEA